MAVREHWEIKGIQWIAVQEDWVTVVSQADTVNFVWWWTVTDVWWVATINIPQWATWYREDVPMGSVTYTFVNSPATATSFLIFTDSGTLLFSWIDYTYDPDTETVTFLSLWANERAYIWVAHASVNGGNVWDMVKAVYDPNNVQQNVYDYDYFINTPTIPTTVAELDDSSDYVTDTELSDTLEDYALKEDIPTKTSELQNDSWFLTSAWDVDWPASSTDWNIVVFNGNTGKVIKDSGLNIQVSNNPSGNPCNIFYDNGTIYLQVVVPSNILLENDDNLITEDDKNIILEN